MKIEIKRLGFWQYYAFATDGKGDCYYCYGRRGYVAHGVAKWLGRNMKVTHRG